MIDQTTVREITLLCATSVWLAGQVAITDTLVVTFPSEVHVGSQLLPAGEYTIRQLSTSSSPRLLEFSTNKGTAIQASATSIAAVDINNQNDSSVILERRGNMQYVYRIWVKGKSYGYEFPVAEATGPEMTSRSKTLRLQGTYAAGVAPAKPVETVTAELPTATAAPTQASSASESSAATARAKTPVAEEPKPNQDRATDRPADTPSGQSTSSPAASNQTAPASPATSTPDMPETSLDWLAMTLVGFGLLTVGFILRAGKPLA